MGGTYWPALGGKPGTIGYDWYSMYALTGSGTNLNLTIRNASGANRLRWAWGDAVDPNAGNGTGGSSTVRLVNGASAKCIDVVGGSTANNAEIIQYTCGSAANQQWRLTDAGNGYVNIVAAHSGKCLDVTAPPRPTVRRSSSTPAAAAPTSSGRCARSAAPSSSWRATRGKCLDVPSASTANGTRLKQYTCNSGTNQLWSS